MKSKMDSVILPLDVQHNDMTRLWCLVSSWKTHSKTR